MGIFLLWTWRGGPSGMSRNPKWRFEPNLASARLGPTTGIGDVNGDGLADVAANYNNSTTSLLVFHGRP